MALSPSVTGNDTHAARIAGRVLRIVARTLSVLILTFTVVMFIGETVGGSGPFQAGDVTFWGSVAMAVVLVAPLGLAVAWRWEVLGGALVFIGEGSVALVALIAAGDPAFLFFLCFFGAPAALFVLAGLATRYANRSRRPTPPADERGARRVSLVARTLKLLLLGLTLGTLAPLPVLGGSERQPPPPFWDAYASEELTIRLLRFMPGASEAPPGYRFGPMVVDTPATLAPRIAQPGEDPRAALARAPGLPVVQISQELLPAGPAGPPILPFFVIARLTPHPMVAADNVSPSRRPEGVLSVELRDPLGEERDAFLDPRTRPGQPPTETLVVRWRRGGVVIELIRGALAGESDVEGTLAYAARLDAKAAGLPLPGETPPTVTAPATEAERLEALLRLRTFSVRPEDLPAPYWPAIAGMSLHPAQSIANAARFQPRVDPAELVRLSAGVFRQVYLGGGWLTNAPEEAVRGQPDEAWPGVRLVYFASVDADDEAAGRHVRDTFSMLMGTLGPERTPSPAEGTLGEETYFWRVGLDGTESWALRWRHGSVVLGVESVGPVGALASDELIAIARAVEAAYQRSDLAR